MVVIAFLAVAFREPAEKYFDIAKSLDIFATLFKEVNATYVDEVDPEKLIRMMIIYIIMRNGNHCKTLLLQIG